MSTTIATAELWGYESAPTFVRLEFVKPLQIRDLGVAQARLAEIGARGPDRLPATNVGVCHVLCLFSRGKTADRLVSRESSSFIRGTYRSVPFITMDKLFDAKDLAERWQFDVRHIYRLYQKRDPKLLPRAVVLPGSRRLRWRLEDIEAFEALHLSGTPDPAMRRRRITRGR